ncbi:unnamed protein product [Sphagnum balticum]
MQKWGKFTKKISSYFAGHPLANKQSAPRAVPKRGRGFSARLFLVNHFFSSQDAALTTQSLIYAKEGTAALKKAAAMAALLADTTQRAGTLYQQYKQARVNQSIEAVALLTTLIDAILQDHPALAVKAGTPAEQVDGIRARLRDAMQTHITNLATFELNPANLNKRFPSPYVSPDTTYATMAANYQRNSAAPPPGNQSHAIKRPSSTASMYQSMPYSNDSLMLSEIKVNMEEKSQLTQASL